jgi:hypothetical protein
VPIRPSLGRIERTRFNALAHAIAPLFRRHFAKRLEKIIVRSRACAVHAIAHGGLDFYDSYLLATKMRIPFFLQLHDDLAYTAAGRAPEMVISQRIAEAWRNAQARFMISSELGREYNQRYGARDFVVVTDGLDHVAAAPRKPSGQLRIYFMGLFHFGYEQNLEALIKALELIPRELVTAGGLSITLRCDYLRPVLLKKSSALRVLPFGSESDVVTDFATADCLYLPLHFSERDRAFGAYSLSTKMVTYLGSGIPILYHGPAGTAAHNMLSKYRAAVLATSLEPAEIASVIAEVLSADTGSALAANALGLARAKFLRTEQHEKFWNQIMPSLNCARASDFNAV